MVSGVDTTLLTPSSIKVICLPLEFSFFLVVNIMRILYKDRLAFLVNEKLDAGSGPTCILDGHLHRVTHSRCCIDTIDSPDDENEVARNMLRTEINI
jgi:hypothetical protein